MAERRRRAPGWLDREERLLEPEKAGEKREMEAVRNLMDERESEEGRSSGDGMREKEKEVEDLGSALDRAFGRSEMG